MNNKNRKNKNAGTDVVRTIGIVHPVHVWLEVESRALPLQHRIAPRERVPAGAVTPQPAAAAPRAGRLLRHAGIGAPADAAGAPRRPRAAGDDVDAAADAGERGDGEEQRGGEHERRGAERPPPAPAAAVAGAGDLGGRGVGGRQRRVRVGERRRRVPGLHCRRKRKRKKGGRRRTCVTVTTAAGEGLPPERTTTMTDSLPIRSGAHNAAKTRLELESRLEWNNKRIKDGREGGRV